MVSAHCATAFAWQVSDGVSLKYLIWETFFKARHVNPQTNQHGPLLRTQRIIRNLRENVNGRAIVEKCLRGPREQEHVWGNCPLLICWLEAALQPIRCRHCHCYAWDMRHEEWNDPSTALVAHCFGLPPKSSQVLCLLTYKKSPRSTCRKFCASHHTWASLDKPNPP